MALDDIFKEFEEKKRNKAENCKSATFSQQDSYLAKKADRRSNANSIAAAISTAIDHVFERFRARMLEKQFDINQSRHNQFLEGNTHMPPSTRGVIYMKRGGVISRLGDYDRPFIADHEFVMLGQVDSGELLVDYVYVPGNKGSPLARFGSAKDFTTSEAIRCFEEFVRMALENEIRFHS